MSRSRSVVRYVDRNPRADYRDEERHQRDYKRIIVACDGTWLNADAGVTRQGSDQPSNVTRFIRALLPETSDGVQQVSYYSHGVGSRGGLLDRLYGGITGEGIAGMIREAYSFICTNWSSGDEIFLFGFSRGAFTARAVAGLIDEIGLLTRAGQKYLPEIYADVRNRRNPRYHPKRPDQPFRNKPSANDPGYMAELRRRNLVYRQRISVTAVGVWDTVGALGTPRIGWLERIGLQGSVSRESLGFYDTALPRCVENAFQALALDEHRAAFSPALWERPHGRGRGARLRQVWFPGVHSNCGGGYDDQGLADITLAWMMNCCRDLLAFNPEYVLDERDETARYYRSIRDTVHRDWAMGKIPNSAAGVYMLGGEKERTPGRYFRVEPRTGRETDVPLKDTNEYVHPSVRARVGLKGPGYDDEGRYRPEALEGWEVVVSDDYGKGGRPGIYWRSKEDRQGSSRILPESPLGEWEKDVLIEAGDERVEDYVLEPESTEDRRHGRGRSRKR